MDKALLILEVSQKQDYIFSSNKLKENVIRSNQIACVTGDDRIEDFFTAFGGGDYDRSRNLVNAGGGHTVFQFDTVEQARRFAGRITYHAMREFPGMEVFASILDAAEHPGAAPGELLRLLSGALERKKSVRAASFRRMSLGVEHLESASNWRPVACAKAALPSGKNERFSGDDHREFEDIAGGEGFLAVVHIDGNSMGKRVQKVYADSGDDWELCCRNLRAFSDGIARDFEGALDEMEAELAALYPPEDGEALPLRRVIAAGDDICFVARGSLGLEAARIYLEKLAARKPLNGQAPYAACAGVALVHTKYPFHMAYDMAEELCSSAKRFGAEIDEAGQISAIDWHIEFGQLKDSLGELRREYITEDSTDEIRRHMELRPLAVVVPETLKPAAETVTGGVRTWTYFERLCGLLKASDSVARSKLKGLRSTLRQGETETLYYLIQTGARDELARMAAAAAGMDAGDLPESLFLPIAGEERSLIFDAIELMDHSESGKEERE